ncbi:unnamed protein product [Owenia fusiformis]|uniref:Conserved oligomeric Golgi complex subunit 3 n=1 Tax=Owenia fusiformis TaxID=6347 RepID=A0A8S4NN62_OWEFU|nr:unnamed protein product [Owenia fusiformis]
MSWTMWTLGALYLYHFIPLQIVSFTLEMNLNNMLCPGPSDPLYGPYYRLLHGFLQQFVFLIHGKIYTAVSKLFLPFFTHEQGQGDNGQVIDSMRVVMKNVKLVMNNVNAVKDNMRVMKDIALADEANMADNFKKKMSVRSVQQKLTSWETQKEPRASLTDTQRDAIMELTSQSSTRPMPIELPLHDVAEIPNKLTQPSADSDVISKTLSELSLTTDKIYNAQQFFTWFADVEDRMFQDEEVSYRNFTDQLAEYRMQCKQVLDEVSVALQHLENLQKQYVFVSTKTNTLHEACEDLLSEQTKLVNTAESIDSKLSYFNELDRISSKLGSPTLTVTNEAFVPMLSRLDECIAYINQNPHYKESQAFMARFKLCLSKALNLVKTHVVHILQNATTQVLPKKDVQPGTDNNAFTLFYGKFRTNAPRVKSLMEQIEQRIEKSPEYSQLLSDCHACYFQQRETLLCPSVASAVAELASKHVRDHCALVRSGCAFMVHVCEDEHQLYQQFFTKPTSLLDEMLEKLCNILYDVFRPLIIHINHLETLSELCSILKIEMLEEHVQNNDQELSAFEAVCSQMLEDVQERLVYRTYIYIRTDILNYNPAGGDLAYPEKLEMMEEIAESVKKTKSSTSSTPSPGPVQRTDSEISVTSQEVAEINAEKEKSPENGVAEPAKFVAAPSAPGIGEPLVGQGSNMSMSPADLHGMWYPTVRRTLVCLSKLYRCIDRTTFQGLSQEALAHCIQSLTNASEAIVKRKNSKLDGQLFLVKHLLILREQIAPFHVDFAVREMSLDFSKFKDAAYGLYSKKSKMFNLDSNNALLQFIFEGTPQVMENFVDSKRDVDNQLKTTCEDLIHHVTELFTGPLRIFIDKSTVILKMNKEKGGRKVSLKNQPFASPEKLHDTVAETYRNLKSKLPKVQRSMGLYLANRDTEYILFKPIKMNVQQIFQSLHQMLQENYSEEDMQIVATPAMEQVNLLLTTRPTSTRPSVS